MDSIVSTITSIVKIAFIVAVSTVFLIAITTFLGFIGSLIYDSVIGEIFGVISMCLPFDLHVIFASVAVSISAITTFLVAAKIYNLFHLSFFSSFNI